MKESPSEALARGKPRPEAKEISYSLNRYVVVSLLSLPKISMRSEGVQKETVKERDRRKG